MSPHFSFGNFRAPSAPPSGGILQPGVRYWGACGHIDQGGIYTSRSVANQAADLKNIFGSTPDTIVYRAFGDSRPHNLIGSDVVAFQAEGIIPLVLMCTYPDWDGLANEAAAYTYAYNEAASVISNAPTAQLYEIGNEWNLQVGGTPAQSVAHQPSAWTGLSFYPKFRGVAHGALQAIRDNAPNAQVILGPTSGWVNTGFVPALQNDLWNSWGLAPDFACNHWYNGQFINGFGLPDSVNGAGSGGSNSYASMRPTGSTPKVPQFHSEFGASAGGGSSDATASSRITGLMDNYYARGVSDSGTQLGVIGGCVYELYPHGVFATEYYLCNTDGSLKPQGTAVKNWIAAHA